MKRSEMAVVSVAVPTRYQTYITVAGRHRPVLEVPLRIDTLLAQFGTAPIAIPREWYGMALISLPVPLRRPFLVYPAQRKLHLGSVSVQLTRSWSLCRNYRAAVDTAVPRRCCSRLSVPNAAFHDGHCERHHKQCALRLGKRYSSSTYVARAFCLCQFLTDTEPVCDRRVTFQTAAPVEATGSGRHTGIS